VRAALLAIAVGVAAGCGDHPPPIPTCDDTFVGDPSLPPEAVLVVTDGVSEMLVDVASGDAVPLVRPPQGGQVTYAAARVRNIYRCAVQLRGRYRDPDTNEELGFDGRTTDLQVGDDGWLRPAVTLLSDFANVPLCPDYSTTRDNVGTLTTLEVTAIDQHGHSVTVSQLVVPTCTATDPAVHDWCVCECSKLPATMMRSCGADMSI
jgi:hypothetical protein